LQYSVQPKTILNVECGVINRCGKQEFLHNFFHRLHENWNGSMETGKKSVFVKHVGKEVIVDSEKQNCRWACITKTLQ
jgi:hypothetical protein